MSSDVVVASSNGIECFRAMWQRHTADLRGTLLDLSQ